MSIIAFQPRKGVFLLSAPCTFNYIISTDFKNHNDRNRKITTIFDFPLKKTAVKKGTLIIGSIRMQMPRKHLKNFYKNVISPNIHCKPKTNKKKKQRTEQLLAGPFVLHSSRTTEYLLCIRSHYKIVACRCVESSVMLMTTVTNVMRYTRFICSQ